MLYGWVSQMAVFIIWKLEWMETLFKLTFKREVVTALLEYNCFDYFFQVSFVNTTASILLWILTLFRALNISVNTTHPEILQQSRLKWETKFNWRGHQTFFRKSYWTMKYLALWTPWLQNILPPSYILDVDSPSIHWSKLYQWYTHLGKTFLQLLLLKVCETFLFGQSNKVYSMLWSVRVFFAFLERQNRYWLWEESFVFHM